MLTPSTILAGGRTVKTTLSDIICRTMPTAAVASGFCSQVDQTATVNAITDLLEFDSAARCGLPALRQLLEDRGLPASLTIARGVRQELIRRTAVRESRAVRPATKCIEVLPATKSSSHNSLTWTPNDEIPGEGVLVVDTVRSRTLYAVREFKTLWAGRAFKLDVIRGGTDPESERYDVLVARDGRGHLCDCKGFSYGRGKPCKHIAALAAVIENRWV